LDKIINQNDYLHAKRESGYTLMIYEIVAIFELFLEKNFGEFSYTFLSDSIDSAT
jgi:hypothetical protein